MSTETSSPHTNPGLTPETRSKTPAAIAGGDKYIWAIYICLCLISIVELYSASSREVGIKSSFGVLGPVVRHIVMLLGGLGVILFLQRRHYREFWPATYLFVLISVGLMCYVLFKGEIVNGARRSLTILGFQIQPAEFIKLSAVLVVSMIIARNQESRKGRVGLTDRGMWLSAAVILVFSALLAKQGMTNTLLLMSISLSMMLIGGVKMRQLMMVLGIYAVCGALFVGYLAFKPSEKSVVQTELMVNSEGKIIETEVVKDQKDDDNRLSTWLARIKRYFGEDSVAKYDRAIDANNRQEMYAYMAQANSRGIGVGPGNSRESARLPLAFSDFIYSIVVEDLGLLGGIFVLILYLCLLGRASGIASRCERAYPAMLVLGMAVMIAMQALVHMAINTGVAPVSGQPLPLISKGGSSILTTSIALGIMLSVSRYAANSKSKSQAIKQELDALPEDLRAINPTQL